jgi:cellulose synthase/poly-beta-1,6-N-acetylglucosamine synthase-like glycosyltransferase
MISIIITAFKEEKTIGKAIEVIQREKLREKTEIIISCPDKATADVVKSYQKKHKNIILIKDPGKGKPLALNLALKKAKGAIIILTDGDVYVGRDALPPLIAPFKDKRVGAVSGRPISTNARSTMLGYWSHLLTDIGAHKTREKLAKNNKFIVCTGYLYAIRNGLVKSIPQDSLSDDAIITSIIAEKGYKIAYSPKSEVFIKYPTTLNDWIKQKKRSTGGYLQIKELAKSNITMRSFLKEAMGIFSVFSYSKNLQEFLWTLCLIAIRIYLWIIIFIDIKIKKEEFSKTWKRVESTK